MAQMSSSLQKWEPIARIYNPMKAGSIDGTDTTPHDRGIVRAMQAEYKPNKLVEGDPKATVFVGRLNPSTDEDTLRKLFSECGKILNVRIVRDIVTGFSRGYAFIEYHDRYGANRAQRDLHQSLIDDREVIVDWECSRLLSGWIPRRLGGGLSGKKESGQLRFGGKVRPFRKPLLLSAFRPERPADRRDRHYPTDRQYSERRHHRSRHYD